jgi:hypothetical protein
LRSPIGTGPGDSDRDAVALSEQVRNCPLRVRDCGHDTADRVRELASSAFGFGFWLMVHNAVRDQLCEIDAATVPSLVEASDDIPVARLTRRVTSSHPLM